MEWEKHANKFLDRLTDILAGAFGAGVYQFLTEKKRQDGTVVLDKDNNPVMTVDPDKIRTHAPYWVVSLTDEAEFNRLMSCLDPRAQQNMEIQMGQIPPGPFLPGQVPPGLGNHQRADVIKTTVQINEPAPALRPANRDPRVDTLKMLEQLAGIVDPMKWKRRAVAFKLMKANESDYLGAQLTKQASQALVAAIAEFRQAKRDWDNCANARAVEIDAWTRNMRTHLNTRPRGFFPTIRRMFDLPWEQN